MYARTFLYIAIRQTPGTQHLQSTIHSTSELLIRLSMKYLRFAEWTVSGLSKWNTYGYPKWTIYGYPKWTIYGSGSELYMAWQMNYSSLKTAFEVHLLIAFLCFWVVIIQPLCDIQKDIRLLSEVQKISWKIDQLIFLHIT